MNIINFFCALAILSPFILSGVSIVWNYWKWPLRYYRSMRVFVGDNYFFDAINSFLPADSVFQDIDDPAFQVIFHAVREWAGVAFFGKELRFPNYRERLRLSRKFVRERKKNAEPSYSLSAKELFVLFSVAESYLRECMRDFPHCPLSTVSYPISITYRMPSIKMMDYSEEPRPTEEGAVVLRMYMACLNYFNRISLQIDYSEEWLKVIEGLLKRF